jgi:hypothetical protein
MGLLNPEKDIKGQKHILAYITPGEADTLQDLGAEEVLTSEGIPAYPPPGERGGGGYMGSSSGAPPGERGGAGPTFAEQAAFSAPSQPSGPDPHGGDWNVTTASGDVFAPDDPLLGEKTDYIEPTQANLLDLYMQYGAIPNAFRLGKAGLEKLGELGSGLQEKAMTWSLENRIKSQMKNLDLDNPNSMNNPKLVDLQIDLQGVKDGTFTQTDFTEKYGSGDVSDQGGGDGERQLMNELAPYASYAIANQTPEESQVDKWFASNQTGTGLDPNYMNTYNTAKAQIANTLGMVDTSNQFGYSSDPYGGLTAQNLATNPYNIDWMQQRGLI